MKTLSLILLLSIILVSVSFGKSNRNVAPLLSQSVNEQITTQARDLTNNLYLNEGEYIKIREALKIKHFETENAKQDYRENPEALLIALAKINHKTEAIILAQLHYHQEKYTSVIPL